jgi:UDP-N-acetylglucosamine--N-acetylmuramyl-(pentapeptide) pyrophosphoryl-undecaprenol N-acetylglucosamine transferase
VYPALAVLQALRDDDGRFTEDDVEKQKPTSGDKLDLLWVAGEGGIEVELLARENVNFTTIPAAGVHGVGLRALPRNLWLLLKGFFAARRGLKEFCPQVLFFTGGYLAVPMALAARSFPARRYRPKILLFVPDIEPGLALRSLARFADRIALSVEESMRYFSNQSKLNVTGYPTRNHLAAWSNEAALRKFSLNPDFPTLFVFGGSKGARSINRAVVKILPELLREMQIIHITGILDWAEVEAVHDNLELHFAERYHVFPYLHEEMGAALKIADVVLSRAGASVLGEFPVFGLPAILVPYPHAWRYQEVNARYLERQGAAIVLPDKDLSAKLLPTIQGLINDRKRKDKMRQAMLSSARPDAANSIANLLRGMVSMPNLGRI